MIDRIKTYHSDLCKWRDEYKVKTEKYKKTMKRLDKTSAVFNIGSIFFTSGSIPANITGFGAVIGIPLSAIGGFSFVVSMVLW